MPVIADSHCHLAGKEFESDLDAVLARAREAGVQKMVVVGTDLESSAASLALAQRFPGILRASVGVHPHEAARYLDEQAWKAIESEAAKLEYCAIGEAGLDYFYKHSPKEAQIEIIVRQIQLSIRQHRPLILHCRDAFEDLREILKREGGGKAFGVIHCFTGSADQARDFLDLGFHISFSGIVTFQNAHALREASRIVPKNRILVETDAPYLAPVPHRGKRNEPAFISFTLEKLAAVRGESIDELSEATMENLF